MLNRPVARWTCFVPWGDMSKRIYFISLNFKIYYVCQNDPPERANRTKRYKSISVEFEPRLFPARKPCKTFSATCPNSFSGPFKTESR